MANFSSFPNETKDLSIENIISEAKDQIVLEQLTSINLSGITSHSLLPTHLETRFRQLKTFPQSHSHPQITPPNLKSTIEEIPTNSNQSNSNPILSKDDLRPNLGTGSVSSSSDDLKLKLQNGNVLSPDGLKPKLRSWPFSSPEDLRRKPRSASFSSPLDSLGLSPEGSSPVRQSCCFWHSSKRGSRKQSKENRVAGVGHNNLNRLEDDDDEYLSDLKSIKKQQLSLKKALKESEIINREAEKVVQWAKKASARFDASPIEIFSSDDDDKFK